MKTSADDQKYMSTRDIAREFRFVREDGSLDLKAVRHLLNQESYRLRIVTMGGRRLLVYREDLEKCLEPRARSASVTQGT